MWRGVGVGVGRVGVGRVAPGFKWGRTICFPRLGRASGDSSWTMPRQLAPSAGGVPTSCAAADAGDNEALCVAAERGHLLGELMGVLLTLGQVEENKVYSR